MNNLITFDNSEYYNGAIHDNYCWSQTINEIEINVILPENLNPKKQVDVQVSPEYLKIVKNNDGEIILEGKLSETCKCSNVVWNISGAKIEITLDKVKEKWWNKLFVEEEPINLANIDCTRYFDELPIESKASIEKIEWDRNQKMKGLPTSEDVKHEAILRKAWNAEGSPFKGTEFDPSIVTFHS